MMLVTPTGIWSPTPHSYGNFPFPPPLSCPDFNGSPAVRPAAEEEITEYLRIRADIAQESI